MKHEVSPLYNRRGLEGRKSMATLKDVAKLASCDISTVSRALNNSAPVHPETRARIMAAVKKLGYRPNMIAKSLKMGRRNLIAFVSPTIRLNIFSDLSVEIQREADRMGYRTLIINTKADALNEANCLNELRGIVDGIIIASTGQNNRLLREIADDGTAVVQLIRKQDESISSVISNYYDASKQAVRFLYRKGCRYIGLLHGNVNVKPFEERLKGYRKVIRELHLPEIIAGTDAFTVQGFNDGLKGTKKLLEMEPQLDAVLAETDLQGLGSIRALKELGISCPDQVKIISLTGFSLGPMMETAMTSMEVPSPEMGSAALRLLIDQIESGDKKKPSRQHIVFNASLTERETT